MRDTLPRHAIVTLSPPGWKAVFDRYPALAADVFVRKWARAGHPVIARRPMPGETEEGGVPLGLPTPPSAGKRRIAFIAPNGAVAGVRAAVGLDCVLAVGCFPSTWRATLAAVDGAAARLGLRTRVFGSLMWQYLSGLPYLSAASDVDLLWMLPAGSADGCDALLQALLRIDARGGPRIDGEVVANGAAVQWRELAAAGRDDLLMVKTAGEARLYPRRRWLEGEVRA